MKQHMPLLRFAFTVCPIRTPGRVLSVVFPSVETTCPVWLRPFPGCMSLAVCTKEGLPSPPPSTPLAGRESCLLSPLLSLSHWLLVQGLYTRPDNLSTVCRGEAPLVSHLLILVRVNVICTYHHCCTVVGSSQLHPWGQHPPVSMQSGLEAFFHTLSMLSCKRNRMGVAFLFFVFCFCFCFLLHKTIFKQCFYASLRLDFF